MSERNAGIGGAGIGGLAAAIALHRGWDITVRTALWPDAVPPVYAGD